MTRGRNPAKGCMSVRQPGACIYANTYGDTYEDEDEDEDVPPSVTYRVRVLVRERTLFDGQVGFSYDERTGISAKILPSA